MCSVGLFNMYLMKTSANVKTVPFAQCRALAIEVTGSRRIALCLTRWLFAQPHRAQLPGDKKKKYLGFSGVYKYTEQKCFANQ